MSYLAWDFYHRRKKKYESLNHVFLFFPAFVRFVIHSHLSHLKIQLLYNNLVPSVCLYVSGSRWRTARMCLHFVSSALSSFSWTSVVAAADVVLCLISFSNWLCVNIWLAIHSVDINKLIYRQPPPRPSLAQPSAVNWPVPVRRSPPTVRPISWLKPAQLSMNFMIRTETLQPSVSCIWKAKKKKQL